jgi:hypothetical protein
VATLEVRPVGGDAATDTLVAGQRYEVMYRGVSHAVESYTLLVSSASCARSPIREVEPAPAGEWDATGLFAFTSMVDAAWPEDRCAMALDDQGGATPLAGTDHAICTFTAGDPGELVLDLRVTWVDETGDTIYESQGVAYLTIED